MKGYFVKRVKALAALTFTAIAVIIIAIMLAVGSAPAGGNAQNGRELFETICYVCHGELGEGSPPFIPPLNRGHAKQMTDDELFKKITEGGKGTGMPPFGEVYSTEQIRDIISYIRELQK